MNVNATDQCRNCGDEFANHEYVKDSITQYKCRTPQVESGYGHYHGGDPTKFFPDGECCFPDEIQNHKEACDQWNAGNLDYKPLRLGIGVYFIEFEQFFEPREHDDDLMGDGDDLLEIEFEDSEQEQAVVDAAPKPCRRCSECADNSHHWIYRPDEDEEDDLDYTDHICKHCDAVGRACSLCEGDGCAVTADGDTRLGDPDRCPLCDGEGVVHVQCG